MSLPLAVPVASNVVEWSVSDLAGALRRTVEDAFGHVRVRGEIFGFRGQHASGHAYFCLKDGDARIDAVVWKTSFSRLKFKPQEGLEVVATGRITTFPGKSTYQIVVDQLELAGIGALMALLDERRRKLAAEGLFAPERKRRPPFLPRVIGVVTSPTGAVIRDILHRLADRFPCHVVVWPVRVQGETCGAEVAAAIAGLNALPEGGAIPRPDVIIVARGGGSLEDLWGFNDEAVVRATVASRVPLIAAIGHETDWTLIDHAADLRAPTPTGAAEMAVPVRAELAGRLSGLASRQAEAALRSLEGAGVGLRSAARALPSADSLVGGRRQRLDLAAARLAPGLLANLRDHERRLNEILPLLAKHAPNRELDRMRVKLDERGGARARDALLRAMGLRRARVAELAERLAAGRRAIVTAERLRLERCCERVAELSGRADLAVGSRLDREAQRLEAAANLLASLGYRSVLRRGYALVRDGEGRPVPRGHGLPAGRMLEVEFADARVAVVTGSSSAVPAEPAAVQPRPVRRTARVRAGLAQPSLFDI